MTLGNWDGSTCNTAGDMSDHPAPLWNHVAPTSISACLFSEAVVAIALEVKIQISDQWTNKTKPAKIVLEDLKIVSQIYL